MKLKGRNPLTHEFVSLQFKKEGYLLQTPIYTNNKQILDVLCPKGHDWKVDYNSFKEGTRCGICDGRKDLNTVKYLVEEEGYKLLSTKYKDCYKTKVELICPQGHNWSVRFDDFRNGARCSSCYGNKKHTVDEIKNILKGWDYTLLQTEYENNRERLNVQCYHGHPNSISLTNLNLDHTCPICNGNISKPELEIEEFIKSLGFEGIARSRKIIPPYEIDYYIPELKVGIEYHGMFYHAKETLIQLGGLTEAEAKNKHKQKADLADQAGIRLIQIFEDEWLHKKELVKKYLFNILNRKVEEKVFARNCLIKETPWVEAKQFLNQNHIGGAGLVGKIRYGLYHKGSLVALLTFLTSKKSAKFGAQVGKFELYKYATSKSVLGGLSRLFKHFCKLHLPVEVFTFTDRRWFTGSSLVQLGFVENGITDPNYFYYKINDLKRIHRFGLRKDPTTNLTEKEQRLKEGYLSIYDAGHIRFNWPNNLSSTVL